MNLNYGIFRSQQIMTINDLAQIGSHNKREKKAYKSNPNIKLELTKNNIELVPLAEKYVKGFKLLVKDYEKEHNERMKTERDDRKRTFNEMLNKSKSVVADELMFTATHKFFDNMNKEEIMKWADTCMDFVYNDLGYKKEQVLHATIHLDELTPHIHCVVVPLVKKLDKRTNTERFTISKKQYIKDNIHLSELQDIYNLRLREAGFDLERGIKGSDRKHIKIKEFKKTTKYYENKVETINKNLDNAMNDLSLITGQRPIVTKAKKSIAAFKLREGAKIGCKVTLRSGKMYDFAYKLFNVALPRVRDFRGVSENSFDGRGNYSMGVKEQLIFPEIEYDKVDKLRGMDIIFVTTAKSDEEAKELLNLLGMPFKN